MSRPPISTRKLSNTLILSECHPTADHKGRYWLYDSTVGCNLAMGAETEEEALLEALEHYQKCMAWYRDEYKSLKSKVDNFVKEVTGDCDCEDV